MADSNISMVGRPVSLIGYACGDGAQITTCHKGPMTLKEWGLESKLHALGIDSDWLITEQGDDHNSKAENVHHACRLLYQTVYDTLRAQKFPITIGGDHSMAIGTWSAVTDFYDAKEDFGLLWIDAHLDAHTPETSPSHAIHGMPAACLLGYGHEHFIHLGSQGRKISPNHLVYIGIRSYEAEEYALLHGLNVEIFTMEDIHNNGLDYVIKKAIEIVTHHTKGFGITIDLDAIDPTETPGVGSPEKDGISSDALSTALQSIAHNKELKAIEIAEYNPDLGHDALTRNTVLTLLTRMFMAP